jgi:hypothetical protein
MTTELDELISINSALQAIINNNINQNIVDEVQNSTLNFKIDVLNSSLDVQNSTLNSQILVENSRFDVQNSALNSKIDVLNSSLDVQNSALENQFITQNSYNSKLDVSDQTFNSSMSYNMNLLQYQQNKQIDFKIYDFIFFAIIISALLVIIIVKGFKRV